MNKSLTQIMTFAIIMTFAVGAQAQQTNEPLPLPSPEQWRALKNDLLNLNQRAFVDAVQKKKAKAERCSINQNGMKCHNIRWTINTKQTTIEQAYWTKKKAVLNGVVMQNVQIKRAIVGNNLHIDKLSWQQPRLMLNIQQVVHQNATPLLKQVIWLDDKNKKQASAARIDWQEDRWKVTQLKLTAGQYDVVTTKQRGQNGWLIPQLTYSRGMGLELAQYRVFASQRLGFGALINPGNYYMGGFKLYAPQNKDTALGLVAGASHQGELILGTSGKTRIGSAYRHLSIETLWSNSDKNLGHRRIESNDMFHYWQRNRLGLSAAGQNMTLQATGFFDKQNKDTTKTQGIYLQMGTSQKIAQWSTLRADLSHIAMDAMDQNTLNQSEAHVGLGWLWGQEDRIYLRGQTSGWMYFQVEEAMQGWSAASAARMTAQLEFGLGLTGRGKHWRHDLSPRLIGFAQPVAFSRQDNLTAKSISNARGQTWYAGGAQIDNTLHFNTQTLDFDAGIILRKDPSNNQWMHSLHGKLNYQSNHIRADASWTRVDDQNTWQVGVWTPERYKFVMGYQFGNQNPHTTRLASSFQTADMVLAQRTLIQSMEEDPSLKHDQHQATIKWQHDTQNLQWMGFYGDTGVGSMLTHKWHMRRLGWSIGSTGSIYEDVDGRLQFNIGLGLFTRSH